MPGPQASRPHIPGYGVLSPSEGTGLLPWPWAEERLAESRNFWVVMVLPDGRPDAMPVWGRGIASGRSFGFRSNVRSRKARNVAADPRCVITSDDASNPVVIQGSAEIVTAEIESGALPDAP